MDRRDVDITGPTSRRPRSSGPDAPRVIGGPVAVLLGAVLVVGCLYWLSAIAIPLALACLLAFLLAPLVGALERGRVPPAVAVILVVVIAVSAIGAVAQIIGFEVSVLAQELPRYRGNILAKIAEVKGLQKNSALGRLQQLAEDMLKQLQPDRGGGAAPSERPVPVVVEQHSPLAMLPSVVSAVVNAGLVLILLIFTLLRRQDLRNRMIWLFGSERLALTTKAFDDAAERITRYLGRQALINTGFGLALAIGLFAIGVPYAVLWGFLGAVLRFIPYVGPVVAALLPALLALALFPGWTSVLLVLALVATVEATIYFGIEPWFYGRGVGVSEVALLVGLAFWTWLWGPIGVLLGTPMTVCFVVFAKHVPSLTRIAMLLSDTPPMPDRLVFYQRLIAGDRTEADRLARQYLEARSREELFDDLLLPAIARMGQDHRARILTDDDRRFVLEAIEAIARELAPDPASPDARADAAPAATDSDRPKALGFPLQNAEDELALKLFALLLDPTRHQMMVVSSELLASEMLAMVEREAPAAVCIGGVSAGGSAQSRYLVKRLRAGFPDLCIVVARWGIGHPAPEWRDRLIAIGANYVGTTIPEVRAHLVHFLLTCSPNTATPPRLHDRTRAAS